ESEGAVHRAAFQVHVAELAGEAGGDGGLARPGGAINRDDQFTKTGFSHESFDFTRGIREALRQAARAGEQDAKGRWLHVTGRSGGRVCGRPYAHVVELTDRDQGVERLFHTRERREVGEEAVQFGFLDGDHTV